MGDRWVTGYHEPMHEGPNARVTAPAREVLTVSALNREARRLLESGFGVLWVEGEISNLARPGSGHWYFSLKDSNAQVQCAMFRQRNRLLPFQPADGDQVQLRARVSLYEPRGNYQLIVDFMEPAGEGALRQAFEKLKNKLDAEGLFALARKRPLPTLPRQLGIITSPSGAAVRDILKVLRRRFPSVPVLIYPVPVQGAGAAKKIVAMLQQANQRKECDVLILTRGGGSLEDLWAFNEEPLARAIAVSGIPVISAVGHEVDTTIADLVADLRAPTPSAAAELVVPDRDEWLRALLGLNRRLDAVVGRGLSVVRDRWNALCKRLLRVHPSSSMQQLAQRNDELTQRLHKAMAARLQSYQSQLAVHVSNLRRVTPARRVERYAALNDKIFRRLCDGIRRRLQTEKSRLAVSTATLDAVSPLATLSRGYSILQRAQDGAIVRRAEDVKKGEVLDARLGAGRLQTKIIDIIEE